MHIKIVKEFFFFFFFQNIKISEIQLIDQVANLYRPSQQMIIAQFVL